MNSADLPSVYLDQNILGYVRDGSLRLDRTEEVEWIYSNEHFEEIQRGSDRSFLDVLKQLKARRIEVQQDEQGRCVDEAVIHPYACPAAAFDEYMENSRSPNFDIASYLTFLARLYGSDNQDDVKKVPDRIKTQVDSLLSEYGLSSELSDDLERVTGDLDRLVSEDMGCISSLETMRRPMGTSGGRAGDTLGNDPLREIWELVSENYPDITIDEFYGFSPKEIGNYEKWPTYLGIIGCHSVMNFVGYRTDKKIADETALPGILSDGVHIANASFCQALISEDRRFCDKAAAIYQYRQIGTQVIRLIKNG